MNFVKFADEAKRWNEQEEPMGSDADLLTVQKMYAAFGKGDVAFILEQLADDVSWEFNVARSDVP